MTKSIKSILEIVRELYINNSSEKTAPTFRQLSRFFDQHHDDIYDIWQLQITDNDNLKPSSETETATGEWLDKIGEMLGIKKWQFETDEDYRKRLLESHISWHAHLKKHHERKTP